MSDFKYPEFKFAGRVNEKVAAKYRYRWGGRGKEIKNDAAAARRAATHLKNAVASFDCLLGDEQRLALRAGAAAMGKLAAELESMKAWACALIKHEEAERKAREQFELTQFSRQRWADDAAMGAEEEALRAWCSGEGEAWLIARHNAASAYIESSHVPAGLSVDALRVALARQLLEMKALCSGGGYIDGRGCWFSRWADYEAFLSARRAAGAAAGAALAKLA
jgi:hypothetical protein